MNIPIYYINNHKDIILKIDIMNLENNRKDTIFPYTNKYSVSVNLTYWQYLCLYIGFNCAFITHSDINMLLLNQVKTLSFELSI